MQGTRSGSAGLAKFIYFLAINKFISGEEAGLSKTNKIYKKQNCNKLVYFRGRGQAELDWRNVDTVLLWGINIQASLKVN